MSRGSNPRIAILASRGGSTAEAFIKATQDNRIRADVGLVICNNPPENPNGAGKKAARTIFHNIINFSREA